MSTFFSSRLRKAIAWLALCAMGFGAAAPTVSKWLAWSGQASDLLVICEQHGTMLVPAAQLPGGQPAGHDGQPGNGDDFCPYCTLLHHWPYAPMAAAAFAAPPPPRVMPRLDANAPAPVLRAGYTPYLPRAPPATALA